MIEILTPDLRRAAQADQGGPEASEQLFTNEYINPAIGLSASAKS